MSLLSTLHSCQFRLNLDNQSAYDEHLDENVHNVNNNKNKNDYALEFVLAVGVPLDKIPPKYQPYLSKEDLVAYAKEKYKECDFAPYLDKMAKWQQEIFLVVWARIDLYEKYRTRIGTAKQLANMSFRQWLVEGR